MPTLTVSVRGHVLEEIFLPDEVIAGKLDSPATEGSAGFITVTGIVNRDEKVSISDLPYAERLRGFSSDDDRVDPIYPDVSRVVDPRSKRGQVGALLRFAERTSQRISEEREIG